MSHRTNSSRRRYAGKLLIGLAALCLGVLLAAQQGPDSGKPKQSGASSGPELPQAAITPRVKTACLECHDSSILVQQRLDKKTWGKEVDKMVRWGAVVNAGERDAFVDYFSENFNPDKPPYVPASAGASHLKRSSKVAR